MDEALVLKEVILNSGKTVHINFPDEEHLEEMVRIITVLEEKRLIKVLVLQKIRRNRLKIKAQIA